MESETIYLFIPCPKRDEAIKLCREMVKLELCGTAKVYDHVHLVYTDPEGVQGEDVVIMNLKSTKSKLADIHAFILKNHSWGTPCIEVLPLINDMC